jgi:hypothetical protein
LLLAKTQTVLAELDARLAVLARRVGATADRALLAEATLTLEIKLAAFTTAELANCTDITSHVYLAS